MHSRDPHQLKSEMRVKMAFAVVAILLPLQYIVCVKTGESYPEIVMPSFAGSSLDTQGRFVGGGADVVVFCKDGRTNQLSLRSLFSEAPETHYYAMASFALRPRDETPPAQLRGGTVGARFLKSRIFPGYVLSEERRRYWAGVQPLTVDWLRGRMRELFPGQTVTRVRIAWHEEICTWRYGELTRKPLKPPTLLDIEL